MLQCLMRRSLLGLLFLLSTSLAGATSYLPMALPAKHSLTIHAQGQADLLLLVDSSVSMAAWPAAIAIALELALADFQPKAPDFLRQARLVRFSDRDQAPTYSEAVVPMVLPARLAALATGGGGDLPEDWLAGLTCAADTVSNVPAIIILISDAPFHATQGPAIRDQIQALERRGSSVHAIAVGSPGSERDRAFKVIASAGAASVWLGSDNGGSGSRTLAACLQSILELEYSGGKAGAALAQQVEAALRRNLRYPEAARRQEQEGTVEIVLESKGSGPLQAVLSRSSGHILLDTAALELCQQAAAGLPPPQRALHLLVPVRYRLRTAPSR